MSDPAGRRLASRYVTEPLACALSLPKDGRTTELAGTLVNVSHRGAQVRCQKSLPIGTRLRLALAQEQPLAAVVVRATPTPEGDVFLGLSLVQPWPDEVFHRLAIERGAVQTEASGADLAELPPGCRPIPGMRILRKIGQGGTGIVVEVSAHGGVPKAAKYVRLDPANPLSAHELESLQLVASIQHPFLLTIDRFSVDEDSIVIVMELAECNLADEFRRSREDGWPGVPRQKLLAMLAEAAEVLDLLNFTYGIRHLDIKPENLFVVAGHLKVGDLGLARKAAGDSKEGVAALSPPYAAPELFEGRSSPSSDQYSLAVVFVEMLTGRRPYEGRTIRQLALQHVTAAPDISALADADQPIVARALARDPALRFDTCSEFIAALRETGAPALAASSRGGPATRSERAAMLSRPLSARTRRAVGLGATAAAGVLLLVSTQGFSKPFALVEADRSIAASSPRPEADASSETSPAPLANTSPRPAAVGERAQDAPLSPEESRQPAADGLAALELHLVDEADPVVSKGEIVYDVSVANRGTGVARDIRLAASASPGLVFEGVSGSLPGSVEGGELRLGPIGHLEPGARLEARLLARAKTPGEARLRLALRHPSLGDGDLARQESTFVDEPTPPGPREARPRRASDQRARPRGF